MPALRRLLPLLALVSSLLGQNAPGDLKIEPVERSVWTAPGSEYRLQVRVADGNGSPVADRPVVFVAPGDIVRRVRTSADGMAEVTLGAGESPGPFLVSAWIEGTERATHLAVSAVTSGTSTALDPAAWTAAVRDQIRIAESAVLYGPFLLDEGSVISAGPASATAPDLRAERRSIFFWIDDEPLASYDHPVRFVLLDAGNGNPRLSEAGVVNRRDWWPKVARGSGETAVSLVPPLFRIREIPKEGPAIQASRGFRFAEESDTCVVIIFGPDSAAFENSAADMRSVFKDTLKIPEGNILEDTVDGILGTSKQASTPTRIRELLGAKLKEKNCKKLYFYYAGHGYTGGFCPANESDADRDKDADFMNYTELGGLLEQTKIPEIHVILQACHTASAIPALQNHGFSGTIATASSVEKLAFHNPIPGFRGAFWTTALTQTWRDLATLEGQDISLTTVALAVGEGRDPNSYPMAGDPRFSTIDAKGGSATAPTLVIVNLDDTSGNPAPLTVTAPEGFPAGDGAAEIVIDNPAIANEKGNLDGGSAGEPLTRLFLRGGKRDATFQIQGLAAGSTGYTLTMTDRDGKTYTGRGTIRVGAGYQVTPARVGVYTGKSSTISVTRGSELQAQPNPARLTVTPADSESAAVATPSATEIVFPPGAAEQKVDFRGLKPGTATYRISDGKTTKTVTIDVSGLSLVPASLRLKVGETATVQVTREGPLFNSVVPPTVTITPPTGAAFATVTPLAFPFPTNQRTFPITVRGTAVGSGNFAVASPTEGLTLNLPVTVEAITGCSVPPRLNAIFTVKLDRAGHDPFLLIRAAVFDFLVNGASLTLTPSGNINLPRATGTVNSTGGCRFTAQGRGTSAGFPAILTEYIMVLDPATGRWTGTTEVGKGGGLPQDQSITYDVVGTVP